MSSKKKKLLKARHAGINLSRTKKTRNKRRGKRNGEGENLKWKWGGYIGPGEKERALLRPCGACKAGD